jgi:hypothetical protein
MDLLRGEKETERTGLKGIWARNPSVKKLQFQSRHELD